MRTKQSPEPKPLTAEDVLQHIRTRLQTLGNKTHGPQYSDDEKARASHGIRELVKLQTWINSHTKP